MDNQAQAPQLYGVNKPTVRRNLEEKLADLFGPSDFVRVINPDDKTFWWQSLNPSKEQVMIEKGPTKNVIRDLPDLYSIEPGESKVLQGWNARLMIIGLYKKLAAKDAMLGHPDGKNIEGKQVDISFGWNDESKQDQYINRIFIGIETPTFDSGISIQAPTAQATVEDVIREPIPINNSAISQENLSKIEKDLGLVAEERDESSSKSKETKAK